MNESKKKMFGVSVLIAVLFISALGYVNASNDEDNAQSYIDGRFDIIEYPKDNECVLIISRNEERESLTGSSNCWKGICYEKIYADCDGIHEMLKDHYPSQVKN